MQELLDKQFESLKLQHHTTRQVMIESDECTLVVCSGAMSPEGLVVASIRHGDPLFYDNAPEREHYHDWRQGFITNNFFFVTRKEAFIIAKRQGQIRNKLPTDDIGRLYSENLY